MLALAGGLLMLELMHPASAEIIGLYERHAHLWDQDRTKTLFERPWLEAFRAALVPDLPILDLGCGSGEPIARYFIDAGHRVTGIDASPSLISLCQQRFPDHAWKVADMRHLALGSRFGGILAWDSFFHLTPEDQRAMFPIFRTHAAPGAALMFTSGPAHGEAIGSYRGEALYHASLAPEEYTALLDRHGFHVLRHTVEDANCGGHTIWLAQSP